jgi:hypothetical protein
MLITNSLTDSLKESMMRVAKRTSSSYADAAEKGGVALSVKAGAVHRMDSIRIIKALLGALFSCATSHNYCKLGFNAMRDIHVGE